MICEGYIYENRQKFRTFESPDQLTKVGRHMRISVAIDAYPGQTPTKIESPGRLSLIRGTYGVIRDGHRHSRLSLTDL